jgi:DNA-binding MarR family transcriptional regulator
MSTAVPTLNGQVLGQAERASRAVLDRLLARVDTTFDQWVVLNLTGTTEPPPGRDQLVARMATGLRIAPATVQSTVDGLVAAGMLVDGAAMALTDQGRARFDTLRAELAEVTARLYGDLPAEDLATAGRVLTIVTERANAELAAA